MENDKAIAGGLVYSNFDEVDIAIITDKTLDDALDQVMQTQAEDDPNSPLVEALNMSKEIDKFSSDTIPDVPTDADEVSTKLDPIEMSADEYIRTFNDTYGPMDVGDMIDMIADTQ